MIGRITYALRETLAGFRRNFTLTAAAIVTSAVSLLLVGATFLIQSAFDNLLTRWGDSVELIVFVNSTASTEQKQLIEDTLRSQPQLIDVAELRYLDPKESMEEAERLFAGKPELLQTLTEENIPTQWKVVPTTDDTQVLRALGDSLRQVEGVYAVAYASEQFDIIDRVSNFVSVVTTVMSVVLLAVAVGLIWNTIRTAMFARRREIEVMKLVGATNWFIRVPFMLEGLLQGIIGGVTASAGLWLLNTTWTNAVTSFDSTDLAALVVGDGYVLAVMAGLMLVGAIAGTVGSGIAASKFLDV